MAAEVDVLARALADLNVVARSEFKLKPEQEVAVKSLIDGKDALAVLPTGYGKSLIYQMCVRAKDFEMNGTVSCPISGHLQNCNILPQNTTNELKFSHNVASTADK